MTSGKITAIAAINLTDQSMSQLLQFFAAAPVDANPTGTSGNSTLRQAAPASAAGAPESNMPPEVTV